MFYYAVLVQTVSYQWKKQVGVDSNGFDLGYASLNIENCQLSCSGISTCLGMAYNKNTNIDCWRKYRLPDYAIDPENPPAPGSVLDRDIYVKISNSSILNFDYQKQADFSYTGTLLITFANQSITYCNAQCDIYSSCDLVLINSFQNRCHLLQTPTNGASNTGYTSFLKVPKSTIYLSSQPMPKISTNNALVVQSSKSTSEQADSITLAGLTETFLTKYTNISSNIHSCTIGLTATKPIPIDTTGGPSWSNGDYSVSSQVTPSSNYNAHFVSVSILTKQASKTLISKIEQNYQLQQFLLPQPLYIIKTIAYILRMVCHVVIDVAIILFVLVRNPRWSKNHNHPKTTYSFATTGIESIN